MDWLCIEIMDSDKVDWQDSVTRRDMLDDKAWRSSLFARYHLSAPDSINARDLARLKQLRSDMQAVVMRLQKHPGTLTTELLPINKVLAGIPAFVQISGDGTCFALDLDPGGSGWTPVAWHIAHSFAQLLARPDAGRIKVCDNDNCRWIFYDRSKNKSRRWCDDKVCGNIMKVRNFRSRNKNRDYQTREEQT